MDIELAKCECCGLKEDCTQEYISEVKANFDGKWLCGLCSEAVRDEVNRGGGGDGQGKIMNKKMQQLGIGIGMEEAVKAHMAFCGKYNKSNPAIRVADGMRQMLRRRSGDLATPSSSSSSPQSPPLPSIIINNNSKKYSRSASTSHVGDIDRSTFSSYY